MIWRRRRARAETGDLPARAQAAAGSLAGPRESPAGGLSGAIARALGRRRAPAEPEASSSEADTAELEALRAELARELEGAAQRARGAEVSSSGRDAVS